MNTILCPVDFSESANNAMEYAAHFAGHVKAELVIMHLLKIPLADITGEVPTDFEKREKEVEEKMKGYCEVIRKDFSIPCQLLVRSFPASLEKILKKEIEEGGYDLLIMGTNGADDYRQFFFGTHTYNTIRNMSVPLLMVPEGCVFKEPKQVVYGADDEPDDEKTLVRMMELLQVFAPTVTVLHVSEIPESVEQERFDRLKGYIGNGPEDLCFHVQQVVDEEVSIGLHTFMNQHRADLLVLLSRRQNLLKRLFHEKVTKKLSYIATYPVLIMNEEV